jgi:hypothetical protein
MLFDSHDPPIIPCPSGTVTSALKVLRRNGLDAAWIGWFGWNAAKSANSVRRKRAEPVDDELFMTS